MHIFAENLTAFMKERGISQSQMAKFLNVGQQTVSKYMNNKIEPSLNTVIKIANFFDVTVGYLLGTED